MNWSDETYVKLYRRDTLTWRSWPWQARALFPLIMRKVDGAGIIETGTLDPAAAVAMQVELPADVVRPGLEALLADGTVEKVPGGLIIPHFVEAQEATKTEARKKRDQRQRAADQRRHAQVAEIATSAVPQRPALSRDVPDCPPPAQPSSAQPTITTTISSPPAHHQPSGTPPRGKPKQQTLPEVVPPPAPKPPTRLGVLVELCADARAGRLIELGLDPDAFPEEPVDYGRSGAFLSAVEKRLPDWTPDRVDSFVRAIHNLWLESQHWSRTRDKEGKPATPYPWGAFITEGQWKRVADEHFPLVTEAA